MSGRELRKRPNKNEQPGTSKRIRNNVIDNNEENIIPNVQNIENREIQDDIDHNERNRIRYHKRNKRNRRRFPASQRIRDPLDLSDLTCYDPDPSYFYENLEDTARINEYYDILKYQTMFNIRNINESRNPPGILFKFFEETINIAINMAHNHLQNPREISITIHNENLISPIYRPFKYISEGKNDAMSLIREFAKVNQSARHGSLLDAPTRIEIFIRSSDEARGCRKLSNMYYYLNLFVFLFRIRSVNRKALIEFKNNDSHCIFYAVRKRNC